MARYKPQDRNSLLLPVVLSDQIVPGSFAFALDYLVDNELDSCALVAWFNNDDVGASAYDQRVVLKIVLLAYSQHPSQQAPEPFEPPGPHQGQYAVEPVLHGA